MNCPYCQQPYGKQELTTGLICKNHAHYVVLVEGAHNDCHFSFTATHDNLRCYTAMCHQYLQRTEWILICDGNILIKFDYLPLNINPDNIDQKLPTLLTFM
jgi:hypothetical protein